MKGLSQHILEKLKVSSHKYIPSIDVFIKEFGEYVDKTEQVFDFRVLESCKDYDETDPRTFINVLPSYEFTRDEEFLNLPSNRNFNIPNGPVYIYAIDMFKYKTQNLNDYCFILHYLPGTGLTRKNYEQRMNFYIFKEDLIDIIGEGKYIEIYEYLKNTNN